MEPIPPKPDPPPWIILTDITAHIRTAYDNHTLHPTYIAQEPQQFITVLPRTTNPASTNTIEIQDTAINTIQQIPQGDHSLIKRTIRLLTKSNVHLNLPR